MYQLELVCIAVVHISFGTGLYNGIEVSLKVEDRFWL